VAPVEDVELSLAENFQKVGEIGGEGAGRLLGELW